MDGVLVVFQVVLDDLDGIFVGGHGGVLEVRVSSVTAEGVALKKRNGNGSVVAIQLLQWMCCTVSVQLHFAATGRCNDSGVTHRSWELRIKSRPISAKAHWTGTVGGKRERWR